MAERKLNCWQYMRCGREPGGRKAAELGVCPASADISFDGINRGRNAGRFCWAVAGTFCGGKVQGSFAEKRSSCFSCEFFHNVRAEEGSANLETKFLKFVRLPYSNMCGPALCPPAGHHSPRHQHQKYNCAVR
jgi:hypothetical protein